jgi:hypothetical protein
LYCNSPYHVCPQIQNSVENQELCKHERHSHKTSSLWATRESKTGLDALFPSYTHTITRCYYLLNFIVSYKPTLAGLVFTRSGSEITSVNNLSPGHILKLIGSNYSTLWLPEAAIRVGENKKVTKHLIGKFW